MNVTILTKKLDNALWIFLDSFIYDGTTCAIVSDATDFGRRFERADAFNNTGHPWQHRSVVDSPFVGKRIVNHRNAGAEAGICVAHFTGLFGKQFVACVTDSGFKYLESANNFELEHEDFKLDGGDHIISLTMSNTKTSYHFISEAVNKSYNNGLCYQTQASAEAAMADIIKFCRLRRLADMVNGDGSISYFIQSENGRWEAYRANLSYYAVDKIFTCEGAEKACELLNSGQFKL